MCGDRDSNARQEASCASDPSDYPPKRLFGVVLGTASSHDQPESQLTPAARTVLAFTGLYLVAAGVGVIVTDDREFRVYLVVVVGVTGAIVALHRRIGFSVALLGAISLLGAVHMAGGLIRVPEGWPVDGRRVLYNLWLIPGRLKFDQVVHFYGSAVGTWACWQWLRAAAKLTRPELSTVTIAALAAIGLGAINETAEFLTTRVVEETNVGGFENTGWDLVSNFLGATVSAMILLARRLGTSPTTKSQPDTAERVRTEPGIAPSVWP
jgi:uncharacterized membrane protein YjdF